MLADIWNILGTGIAAVGNWFYAFIVKSDLTGTYLAVFFIWSTYRFLLSPVFGQVNSDTAKRTRSSNTNGSGN